MCYIHLDLFTVTICYVMYDFIFWVTDAVVMAPISDVKSSNGGLTNAAILSVPDMSEQRQWWQLEEVSGQLSSWVRD